MPGEALQEAFKAAPGSPGERVRAMALQFSVTPAPLSCAPLGAA